MSDLHLLVTTLITCIPCELDLGRVCFHGDVRITGCNGYDGRREVSNCVDYSSVCVMAWHVNVQLNDFTSKL